MSSIGLASTIQEVVDYSDLGGTSLAALTKIRSGRYGQATHYPEQSIELDGELHHAHRPPGPTHRLIEVRTCRRPRDS